MDMIRPKEHVIDDNNYKQHVGDQIIDGEIKKRGMIPRDYNAEPVASAQHAKKFSSINMPTYNRNDLPDLIREMTDKKTRLSDIRRSAGPNGSYIPSLDQNGKGYCWAHSTTMGVMLDRAVRHEPYVRLSAYMIACIIKNYRDEGGWGAQSLEFATSKGIASVDFWPERSMSSSNDNPQMWANAAMHKVSESWVDLDPPVYSRNLSEDQAMTCLVNRQPVIGDFNWWGHSIILVDPVLVSQDKGLMATDFGSLDLDNDSDLAVYTAAFGKRFINSWGDSYGDLGESVLTGSKAIMDGGAAICSTFASLQAA